jgi:hypothetical protein
MSESSDLPTPAKRMAWMWVVWPSFLAACLLEMLVFATVDPQSLALAHEPHNWSVRSIYSISFIFFWCFTLLSSALTAWLSHADPSHKI